MKQAMAIVTTDGKIVLEFGGELSGVCCGEEDKRLRETLRNFGIDTKLKMVQCHLPKTEIVRAITDGMCHISNHINLPKKGGF